MEKNFYKRKAGMSCCQMVLLICAIFWSFVAQADVQQGKGKPERLENYLKKIEQTYGVDLFNRFNMAYKIDNEVHVASKEDFETLVTIKQITADTIVFNNLVETLKDYQEKWEVKIANSWHNLIFAEQLNA